MKRNLERGTCLDESSGESKICLTSASSTCQLSRSSLNTTKSSGVVSESMRVSGLSFCPIPEKCGSSQSCEDIETHRQVLNLFELGRWTSGSVVWHHPEFPQRLSRDSTAENKNSSNISSHDCLSCLWSASRLQSSDGTMRARVNTHTHTHTYKNIHTYIHTKGKNRWKFPHEIWDSLLILF